MTQSETFHDKNTDSGMACVMNSLLIVVLDKLAS